MRIKIYSPGTQQNKNKKIEQNMVIMWTYGYKDNTEEVNRCLENCVSILSCSNTN